MATQSLLPLGADGPPLSSVQQEQQQQQERNGEGRERPREEELGVQEEEKDEKTEQDRDILSKEYENDTLTMWDGKELLVGEDSNGAHQIKMGNENDGQVKDVDMGDNEKSVLPSLPYIGEENLNSNQGALVKENCNLNNCHANGKNGKQKRHIVAGELTQIRRRVAELAEMAARADREVEELLSVSPVNRTGRDINHSTNIYRNGESSIEGALSHDERRLVHDMHTKRLMEIISKQCASVLRTIMNHKWSWPFLEPVDPIR